MVFVLLPVHLILKLILLPPLNTSTIHKEGGSDSFVLLPIKLFNVTGKKKQHALFALLILLSSFAQQIPLTIPAPFLKLKNENGHRPHSIFTFSISIVAVHSIC